MKLMIAVVGTKALEGDFKQFVGIAEELGEEIAKRGHVLLCGGTTGVMEVAPRAAKRYAGATVGIMPKGIREINAGNQSGEMPSSWIDFAIYTGLGGGVRREDGSVGRNRIIVESADAVIALPGSKGTRSEIDYAIQIQTPVVVHDFWTSGKQPVVLKDPLVQCFSDATHAVSLAVNAINRPYSSFMRRV